MVLELRGLAGLDGEVARVVRPRRELVDEHGAVGQEEHLDAGDPDPARGRRGCPGDVGGAGRDLRPDRRGRDDLVADVVALDRLDHRVGGLPAGGGPGDHRRQLALEGDQSLDEEPHAAVQAPERGSGLVLVGPGRVAGAVVAAQPGLQHQWPAELEAGGPPGWPHAEAWLGRMRRWAHACERLVVSAADAAEEVVDDHDEVGVLGVELGGDALALCGGPSARIAGIPTASELDDTGDKYGALFSTPRAAATVILPLTARSPAMDPSPAAPLEDLDGKTRMTLHTRAGGTGEHVPFMLGGMEQG